MYTFSRSLSLFLPSFLFTSLPLPFLLFLSPFATCLSRIIALTTALRHPLKLFARLHVHPFLQDRIPVLVQRPRVPVHIHRHLQLLQSRRRPRILLYHPILDRSIKIHVKSRLKLPLRLFKLRRRERQSRIFVLSRFFQLFRVSSHLLQQIRLLLVVRVDSFFKLFQLGAVLVRLLLASGPRIVHHCLISVCVCSYARLCVDVVRSFTRMGK